MNSEANHLVYIVPGWYGSGIYADCQRKLFSSQHDTGGRILLVNSCKTDKRVRRIETIIFGTELIFFVNVHSTSLLMFTRSCI